MAACARGVRRASLNGGHRFDDLPFLRRPPAAALFPRYPWLHWHWRRDAGRSDIWLFARGSNPSTVRRLCSNPSKPCRSATDITHFVSFFFLFVVGETTSLKNREEKGTCFCSGPTGLKQRVDSWCWTVGPTLKFRSVLAEIVHILSEPEFIGSHPYMSASLLFHK